MHDYILSIVLGIIEGLTEFLPVSSTAHLRIAEALFHVPLDEPYWKMYSVVIQLGAILAVVVYFWRRIVGLCRDFGRGSILRHPLVLTLLAFVVTAVPCYLADKKIGENLENLVVMGAALLIGGVVMWIIDVLYRGGRTEKLEQITPLQAIGIGLAQILSAAFPGTSRSMATIAAGQVGGLTRPAALEFSFFLSIPTMFAASGYKLIKPILKPDSYDAVTMNTHRWIVLAIGFVVSFLVAWGVVAWFMHWVRRRGFTPFAIYRIVVGIIVLIWALAGR